MKIKVDIILKNLDDIDEDNKRINKKEIAISKVPSVCSFFRHLVLIKLNQK